MVRQVVTERLRRGEGGGGRRNAAVRRRTTGLRGLLERGEPAVGFPRREREHGDAPVGFARLDRVEEGVEGGAHRRDLGGVQVGVGVALDALHLGEGRPGGAVDEVRQIVVGRALVLELGDDVALEGAGVHLDAGRPVGFGPELVEALVPRLHLGAGDRLPHRPEGVEHGIADVVLGPALAGQERVRPIGDELERLPPGPGEVAVEPVEPFVRQRPGALLLRQVDDDGAGLVVGGRRVLAARAARPEGEAELAVERERAGRHADDPGEVHQRVVGLVEVGLPALPLDPVAELHAPEAEGVRELLRGDVAAVAVVDADARAVGGAALGGDVAHLVELRDEVVMVLAQVGARLGDRREGLQVDRVARDLLADNPRRPLVPAVDVETDLFRRRLGLPLEGGIDRLEPLERLLLGVALGEDSRHVREGGRLGLGLHLPDDAVRIVAHAVAHAVTGRGELQPLQALAVADGLVEVDDAIEVVRQAVAGADLRLQGLG
ncbi:MAG: hypothetical protein BWX64_01358 [Acidobacteria bacterium ADurb.Bin051]|nr:MAG: hypothetical protein BWX64_01358 [Acidobacteria bacterium ADurb.Bin051]